MAAITAVVAGAATAIGGAVAAGKAHKQMRNARGLKNQAYADMNKLALVLVVQQL